MKSFPLGLFGLGALALATGLQNRPFVHGGRPAPKRARRNAHGTGTITLRANSSLKKHARYLRRKGRVVA